MARSVVGMAAAALFGLQAGCIHCGPTAGGDGGGNDGARPGGDGGGGGPLDGGGGATDGGSAPDAGSLPGDGGASCGDGIAAAPEACDGADLAGQSCTSLAAIFTGGTLACEPDCTFDTSACLAAALSGPVHDFDGDGFADFVVGAPYSGAAPAGLVPGAAMVYFGGPSLVTGVAPAAVLPGTAGLDDAAGEWVASAGDMDGDGLGEVLVSSGQWLPPGGAPDVTRLFLGGPIGVFDTAPDAVYSPGTATYSPYVMSCAGLGDVNGDGFADVALGYWADATVWVLLGGSGAPDTAPDAVLGPPCSGGTGISVAGAGDVNGDAFADLVAGAWGGGTSGMACLWFGGPGAAFDEAADGVLVYDDSSGGGAFGESVASAGDVNGDGYDDVIIGQRLTGDAHLYLGGPGPAFGPAEDALLDVPAGEEVTVAPAGDLNGDLYADVAVGATGDWASLSDPGHVYVYFGGPGAFDVAPDAVLAGPEVNSRFGLGLSSPGDLDGDGFDDLVVGAPAGSPGRVFVYFGGPGTTLEPGADVVLEGAGADFFGAHVD